MRVAEKVVTKEEIVLTEAEQAFVDGFFFGFDITVNVHKREADQDSLLCTMHDKQYEILVKEYGNKLISAKEAIKKLNNLYKEYKNAQEAD
jgi:hypothetical protein